MSTWVQRPQVIESCAGSDEANSGKQRHRRPKQEENSNGGQEWRSEGRRRRAKHRETINRFWPSACTFKTMETGSGPCDYGQRRPCSLCDKVCSLGSGSYATKIPTVTPKNYGHILEGDHADTIARIESVLSPER